jgi:hypothetical protein
MPAMETDEEKAIRYRARADELRALAMLGPDSKVRDALFVIAERYDDVAEALEPERKTG